MEENKRSLKMIHIISLSCIFIVVIIAIVMVCNNIKQINTLENKEIQNEVQSEIIELTNENVKEVNKEYFKDLMDFIKQEYKEKTIYPKQNEVFNAFRYTSFENIKVVILGQDPYHGPKQAEGLSFSVSDDVLKPPSLKNIFKELESDLGIPFPEHNSLKPWAKEGVLLLNAVLTVQEHMPTSHKDKGWETFTDNVIKIINTKEEPVVFILWGNFAKEKAKSASLNKQNAVFLPCFSVKNHLYLRMRHQNLLR